MAEKGKYVYDWPRPMVTADALVFSLFRGRARVLLVNRKYDPFKGHWAVPGGFIEMDEELGDAAARELAEETGLTGVPMEQMQAFGTVGRDPRGRQITVVFMGIIQQGANNVQGGDDAAEARWFDIDALPSNIAFDHAEVIRIGIQKLRRKAAYRQTIAGQRP